MGWQAWLIAATIAALILSLNFGLAVALLRWLRVIQTAPARADEIARREAGRGGARLNATLVNEGPVCNAMALMPMNHMVFSNSLLRLLSDEELAGICAHEAAHLTESKWIFAGRMVGVFTLFPMIFSRPVMNQFGLPGVLMLAATSLAFLVFYRHLGRRMEKRADSTAAENIGNSATYARALEKLCEVNQMPAVMPKRNSLVHPDLYDRMLAVGATPAYERPKLPRRLAWTPLFLYGVFIIQLVFVIARSELAGDQGDQSKHRVSNEEQIISPASAASDKHVPN